ncbi:MAG TPA: iron ABC transporter permease, partial [Petrotogaceae bacterium]|nr:iron ABC transporter permease [Petrotogaceae bacterium]HQC41207.1 iron ABC transporter permease [Petrotogaceae bacterium]
MTLIKEESKNRFKALLKNPTVLVLVILIFIALFIFIVYPLIKVFQTSFTDSNGNFSLEVYKTVFKSGYIRQGFYNSILVAVLTAVIGTFLGFLYAYAINRAGLPFKRFFKAVALMPMVFPPFIGALSIIMLFGFNGLITAGIFGVRNFPVYGLWGLMIAQTISFFPVAFITLDGVISTISPT